MMKYFVYDKGSDKGETVEFDTPAEANTLASEGFTVVDLQTGVPLGGPANLKDDPLGAFGVGLKQGATLGFADDIAGKFDPNMRNQIRADQATAEISNPKSKIAGNIIGGLAWPVAAALLGPPSLATAGGMTAVNAAVGGLSSIGNTDPASNLPLENLKQYGSNAAIGTAIGALPGGAALAKNAAGPILKSVAQKVLPTGVSSLFGSGVTSGTTPAMAALQAPAASKATAALSTVGNITKDIVSPMIQNNNIDYVDQPSILQPLKSDNSVMDALQITPDAIKELKSLGMSDVEIADLVKTLLEDPRISQDMVSTLTIP
jgi:hypothetical protein